MKISVSFDLNSPPDCGPNFNLPVDSAGGIILLDFLAISLVNPSCKVLCHLLRANFRTTNTLNIV